MCFIQKRCRICFKAQTLLLYSSLYILHVLDMNMPIKKLRVLKSIDYCFKWEFLGVVFSFCPKHYLSKSFVFPSHFRQNASTFQTKRPPPGHLLWAGILETCGLSAFLPDSLWFLPELFWISFGQLLDFLIFFIFFLKIVLTFQTKRPLPLGHLPGTSTLLAFLPASLHFTSFEI